MEKSILRCLKLDFKRQMQNKLVAVFFLEEPRFFSGLRFCNGQGHWPHKQWLTVLSRWPSGNLVPPTEAGDTAWSWDSFSGVWDGPGNATHLVSRGASPSDQITMEGLRAFFRPLLPKSIFTIVVYAGLAWRCMWSLSLESWVFWLLLFWFWTKLKHFCGTVKILGDPGSVSSVPSEEVTWGPH